MSQSIEIEFKNLLTKEEFNLIKDYFHLREENFFTQENHYFDTKNFLLKENKTALRVREKNNQLELTLKQPLPTGLLETNQALTNEQFELLKEGHFPEGQIANILTGFVPNLQEIEFFGTLRTFRSELVFKNGLLVLDHSTYLGVEDYELEYEVEDEIVGYKHFKDLLNELKITQKSTPNKVVRFYLQKMNVDGGMKNECRSNETSNATSSSSGNERNG